MREEERGRAEMNEGEREEKSWEGGELRWMKTREERTGWGELRDEEREVKDSGDGRRGVGKIEGKDDTEESMDVDEEEREEDSGKGRGEQQIVWTSTSDQCQLFASIADSIFVNHFICRYC